MVSTSADVVEIHTSDRHTFKKCRQLWDFRSPIRRNLEPIDEHPYFSFGRSIHKGLEVWYNPADWKDGRLFTPELTTDRMVTAFLRNENKAVHKRLKAISPAEPTDQERQEWIDRAKLGEGMLRHYAIYSQANDFGVWQPLYVELKFEVELWPGVVYKGRIDAVFKRLEDNTLWVWDHKSTASIDYGYHAPFEIDPQVGSYAWAMWTTGFPIRGFLFNEMWKKAPTKPEPMKNRRKGLIFSTNQQLEATPELYRQALREYGEPEEPYANFLNYLENREDPFFRRTEIERNPAELQRIGETVKFEAMDMTTGLCQPDAQPFIYPNPTRDNCRGCKFRTPCLLVQEGGDAEYVLNDRSMYIQREDEG